MRTKQSILKDFLTLLNKEKNLGYSEKEIEQKIKVPFEMDAIEKLLLDELYSTEELKGQTISSVRGWFIWCNIIVRYDYKTGDKIWNNFVKEQFLLVERNKQSCYMAQRGGGKTFFLAMYVDFKRFLIPYFDIGYCSNIPRQRKRFLKSAEAIVDTNELL